MLDVCLLGTGGVMPMPKRHLTAGFFRVNGKGMLIDCGEGTQVAIMKSPFSLMDIDYICFTHNHPDHFNGLPGLLVSIAASCRKESITIIGPEVMHQVISAFLQVCPRLPYPLYFISLKKEQEVLDLDPFKVTAFKVDHNTICYGYNIEVERKPQFNVQKAKEYGIPMKMWNSLQHGKSIEYNGKKYQPELFMGEARKGLKVVYCTDSRPCGNIEINARNADLLIIEGMYGDPDKQQDAIEKKHMTMVEAARIASKAKVKEMWFTHFSPSIEDPTVYEEYYKEIYPGKIVPDGTTTTLSFQQIKKMARYTI